MIVIVTYGTEERTSKLHKFEVCGVKENKGLIDNVNRVLYLQELNAFNKFIFLIWR